MTEIKNMNKDELRTKLRECQNERDALIKHQNSHPAPKQPNADSKQTKTDNEVPVSAPKDNLNKPPAATAGRDGENQKAKRFRDMPTESKWLVTASLLTFLATATYAFFAGGQWLAINQQSAITTQSMRYSEASYVVIQSAHIDPFVVGQRPTMKMVFHNAGNTPAYGIDVWANADFRPVPVPYPMPPLRGDGQIPSRGIIGPKSELEQPITVDVVITEEILALINKRSIRFYCWGIVNYKDIFGRKRWTRFCLVHHPDSTVFEPCENNNEASEETEPN